MNIEIRNNIAIISGYVNTIEKKAKPLYVNGHGEVLEIIKDGVFN